MIYFDHNIGLTNEYTVYFSSLFWYLYIAKFYVITRKIFSMLLNVIVSSGKSKRFGFEPFSAFF